MAEDPGVGTMSAIIEAIRQAFGFVQDVGKSLLNTAADIMHVVNLVRRYFQRLLQDDVESARCALPRREQPKRRAGWKRERRVPVEQRRKVSHAHLGERGKRSRHLREVLKLLGNLRDEGAQETLLVGVPRLFERIGRLEVRKRMPLLIDKPGQAVFMR